MIRKYIHIEAPVETVTALFHDYERWAEWMPGIRSVKVLERTGDLITIKLTHSQMGQTLRQIVECRLLPTGLAQRQIKGRFRKWDTKWRFQPSPKGSGTTIALEFDLDIGMLDMVLFSGLVRRSVDRMVRVCARNIQNRLDAQSGVQQPLAAHESEILLQVFDIGGELEVRVGDRVIRLDMNRL